MLTDEIKQKISGLRDMLHKRDKRGLAIYGHVYRKDGEYGFEIGSTTACISNYLSTAYWPDGKKPVAIVHSLYGRGGEYGLWESRRAWINYLINRSPWRHAYILKEDYNEETMYICVRCDINARYMGAATNVIRLGLENNEHIKSWYAAVQAGVNEDLALCLSSLPQGSCNNGNISLSLQDQTRYCHSVFEQSLDGGFILLLSGNTLHNKFWDCDTFVEELTYEGAKNTLIQGNKITQDFKKSVLSSSIVGEAANTHKTDLLGRPIDVIGMKSYSIEKLNKAWEELCGKYL